MWSEIGRGRNTAELIRKHVARSADGLIAEKVTSLPSSHDSLFIGEDEAVNLGAVIRLAMGEVDYQAFVGIECVGGTVLERIVWWSSRILI